MNANAKDFLKKKMRLVTVGFYGLTCISVLLLSGMCCFGPQMLFADPSLKTYLIFIIVALAVLAALVFITANKAINKLGNIEEQISEIIETNAVKGNSEPYISEEIGQYDVLSQKCNSMTTRISIIMVVGCVAMLMTLMSIGVMVLSM